MRRRGIVSSLLLCVAVATQGEAGVPGAVEICSSPELAIPDITPPEGVIDVLVVPPGSNPVADLDVSFLVTHTWMGDLGFVLDDGIRSTVLMDRPGVPATTFGCSGDDMDATLDDEALEPVEDACADPPPAIAGRLSPNGDLSVFDQAPLGATWTLTIHDSGGGDVGTLHTWCLVATLDPLPFLDGFESGDTSAWTSTVP